MYASKIQDFFMQPVSVRSFALDMVFVLKALAIIAAIAGVYVLYAATWVAIVAAGLAVIAILPSLAFAGMGIWALSNGRFFSMGFALMCAIAWFNWLWKIGSV
jgi:hypothetical protein